MHYENKLLISHAYVNKYFKMILLLFDYPHAKVCMCIGIIQTSGLSYDFDNSL